MNSNTFLPSGLIEDYCLGLLNKEDHKLAEALINQHPQAKDEADAFMQVLEQYAQDCAVTPLKETRDKTLQLLENLNIEEKADVNNPAILNKYADVKNWLKLIKPLLPEKLGADMFIKELRNDGNIAQLIIWTPIDYPDEVHTDEQECFFILEGRCKCFIGETVIEMGPGDFLEIPMHQHHDVQVLEPVLALVQRIKVA